MTQINNNAHASLLIEQLVYLEQSPGWVQVIDELHQELIDAEKMALTVTKGSKEVYSERDLACLKVAHLRRLINMPSILRKQYSSGSTKEENIESGFDDDENLDTNPDPYL